MNMNGAVPGGTSSQGVSAAGDRTRLSGQGNGLSVDRLTDEYGAERQLLPYGHPGGECGSNIATRD